MRNKAKSTNVFNESYKGGLNENETNVDPDFDVDDVKGGVKY